MAQKATQAAAGRPTRPQADQQAHRGADGALPRAHADLGRVLHPRQEGDAGRRPLLLPAQRPVARLHRPRQGRAGLGRRRRRVRRLPQRLRRHVHRPREPGRRRGRQGAPRRGHPLRRPDRGLDRRRREPGRALRPAPVALHELRHRVDDGGDPPGARRDRPRPDHQGRGLLRRPPRRGDGLLLPRPRRARPAREPEPGPVRLGLPAGAGRADPPGPLQRPRDPRGHLQGLRGQDRRA